MRGAVLDRTGSLRVLAAIAWCLWLLSGFAFAADDGEEEPLESVENLISRLEELGLEVHGALEYEILHETGFAEPGTNRPKDSGIDVTIDLEVIYAPLDWLTADLAVSWDDEDGDDFEKVQVTFGDSEKFPVYVSIGRTILPFGFFESDMISDPLTLDLTETTTEAGLLGIERGGLQAQVYAYDGLPTRDQRGHGLNVFGGTASYSLEGEGLGLQIGMGWLENIGDSDDLEQFYHDEGLTLKDRVPALTIYSQLTLDPFRLQFEYVGSLEHPELYEQDGEEGEILTRGEKLEAWGCEAAYSTGLPNGMEVILAVGYSRSKGLVDFLPKKRVGGTAAIFLTTHLKTAVEFLREFDYPAISGGTGSTADILTFQAALEF